MTQDDSALSRLAYSCLFRSGMAQERKLCRSDCTDCRVPEEHWSEPCPPRTALDLSCCLVGGDVCAYFLAKSQDKAEMKCEASLQK